MPKIFGLYSTLPILTYYIYKSQIYEVMSTFTSTLPDDLLSRLNELSRKQTVPKNKIIEKALSIYLDQINKAEYIKSYKASANDKEVMDIAEEGMIDYFNQLK